MWSAPIRAANPGSAASGTRPPAGRVAADEPDRDAGRGRVGDVGEAAVPVAVLEQDRASGFDLELGHRLGLGADVVGWPGRVQPPDLADGRLEVRIGHLGRVRCHLRDEREGDRRRIEQDERCGPDAGDRKRRRGHPAPAVTDDLELRQIEGRRADPGGDVGGVVAEPVVAGPVAGLPVARQVEGDDVPSGRRQRRPDPPPDPRRGRDAVDEDERTIRGIVPRPATRTGCRPPRSPCASRRSTAPGSAARTAATAGGRSDMPGRYQPPFRAARMDATRRPVRRRRTRRHRWPSSSSSS